MLILFGTRRIPKDIGETAKIYHCKKCNNNNHYKVTRSRLWFTLFFIPVIPLGSKFFVHCPICNWGAQMKKAEALDLLVADKTEETATPEIESNSAETSAESEIKVQATAEASDNSKMFAE